MSLLNTNIGPERVQVFPQPLGTVQVPGVPTSVTAFLISSSLDSSPVQTPVNLTDLGTFVSNFGGPDEAGQGYYAVEAFFNNAGTGNTAIVVNVGNGLAQVSTVTCVADVSGSLNSTYFLLASANDAIKYYVWYNVGGLGVDPLVAGRTGIMVAVATNASANSVASATATAVNAITASFTASALSAVVTVSNKEEGPSDVLVDGGAPTGFSFSTLTLGRNVNANDYIGSSSLGTGLRSLDNIDVVGLVCAPGLSMPLAYLVQSALIDYAKVVRAEFGATISTTFSLAAMPQEIVKANSDVAVVPSATVSTVVSQLVTLNPVSLVNVTPGMIVKKAGNFIGVITVVSPSTNQITLTTTGSLAPSNVIEIDIPSAVTWKESVINDPSQTNSWYFNWLEVLNEDALAIPGSLKLIDPVGAVAGVMARIDANTSIGGVSHAPAGIQFAGLAGVHALQLSLSERTDAAPLRLNFINRITSFPGAGFIIFGAYTSDSGVSPLFTASQQLVQVIRAVQFIKGSLERGLRGFLWENFSPAVQEQVERAIASFLRSNIYLFPSGLPEAQQFQVVHVEATQDEINQGLLKVRVLIKPNQAVRFIEISLEFPLPSA